MKRKILIADDDADTLTLLSKLLHDRGYEVHSLTNAASVVNGLQEWPDLFILDKRMALIDGIALCKYLKLNAPSRDIPIVMISGDDCRGKAVAAGVDCFLEKPVNIQELVRIVDSYMQNQPA